MRRLHCLVMACALFAGGGCILPCSTGACNAKGRLWEPPLARFNATECPAYTSSKPVCPTGYPTFAKYWPSLDEWSTNQTAKNAAGRTLFMQQLRTLKFYGGDYKDGFTQAYVDIANGGNGECPPIPPPRYWNAFYRSQCGEQYTNQWFDGYRAGAAMGAIQLNNLKQVHASYDWQLPDRKKFAGAEQMAPSSDCQGACSNSLGHPSPSNFVCRPGMGMMGDSPTVPVGPGYLPPGFPIPDPNYSSEGSPVPNLGVAPGYSPPDPRSKSGGALPPSAAPSPGHSGFPGPSGASSRPQSAPLPSPGHSSGSSSGAPSTLPPEPPVY